MKRSLFFFAACFIAVVVITSCEQSREVSNLEQNLNEIQHLKDIITIQIVLLQGSIALYHSILPNRIILLGLNLL